jgi:hypothetical protein
LIVILKENNNLCASNSDLHTFSYNDIVKWSFRFLILLYGSGAFGELSIELMKSCENHCKEY